VRHWPTPRSEPASAGAKIAVCKGKLVFLIDAVSTRHQNGDARSLLQAFGISDDTWSCLIDAAPGGFPGSSS
jgi:hypothetical protein